MESHKQVVERLRVTFRSGVTLPIQFRLGQLEAMLSMLEDNEAQIIEALHEDLAKVLTSTGRSTGSLLKLK